MLHIHVRNVQDPAQNAHCLSHISKVVLVLKTDLNLGY